ncbi:MAG: Fe-S cluster assembly protein SufD [bacterium]|nr:Fe-S cluster assembly protein SufD [bacterium]
MVETATTTPPFVSAFATAPQHHREEPVALERLRGTAESRFHELGFPTSRLEEWRFTNLRSIGATPYAPPANVDLTTDENVTWRQTDAHILVFVDGQWSPALSDCDALPGGLMLSTLAQELRRNPDAVMNHLSRHTSFDNRALAALNTARFEDGAYIEVAAGTVIDRPIALHFISRTAEKPSVTFPRILIVAGEASQFTVIETYDGQSLSSLTVAATEFALKPGALVDHYRVVNGSPGSNHIATQSASLERDSSLRSHSFALGSGLIRAEIDAHLTGEGAEAELGGLYLVDGARHVDHQVAVRHSSPHCNSHQLYKGILRESGRGVFNGRIVVDQDAQKTDAIQSNRNLLLSDGARANSNPQLEIFADDVKCTHGSTVGRLDEDAIFYLRSRGIGRRSAEGLLTRAFAGEVTQRVRLETLRSRLEQHLDNWLLEGDTQEG